jgi:hypothetical protein
MKIGKYELRTPWVKYVDMPIEEELYWEFRRSIEQDILRNDPPSQEPINTFCVKCKDKKIMTDPKIKISDSGRRMAIGACPDCGGKVNRILGRE